MALKYNGQTISTQNIENELTKDLVPDGIELRAIIETVSYIEPQEFKNGNKSEAMIKVTFTCFDKKSPFYRKKADKKYKLEGKGLAKGLEGLEYIFKEVAKVDYQHDLNNTQQLKLALCEKECIVKFQVFINDQKTMACNYISEVTSIEEEVKHIENQAEGRVATTMVDDIEDDIPF